MKALIFAAGLGERMRPLTEHTPKPLLMAGGKPLVAWHLERLAGIGVRDVVINTSWLAEQFPAVLGNGERWGMRISYSYEGPAPLETGGGMLHALRLLDGDDFIALNGDIWSDFDFTRLPSRPSGRAHLVLVDNPQHHRRGDFVLHDDDAVGNEGTSRLTFSGIGLYRTSLLDGWRSVIGNTEGAAHDPPRFKLAPLLVAAMQAGQISGQHHTGAWTDVGTPERLRELDDRLQSG